MRLNDIVRKELMLVEFEPNSKMDALKHLVNQLTIDGTLDEKDVDSFLEVVLKREEISTTGVGDGVAIPHGVSSLIKKPTVVFAKSKSGVDFESMDQKPAHLFFLIATPEQGETGHLEILANLSQKLMDESVRERLMTAHNPDSILSVLTKETIQHVETSEVGYDVLAVTACATGIAHTYMAAEKLRTAAQEMGLKIKVETNGSSGVSNALTSSEIKGAKGIIVAADIKVETDRFNGKPLVNVKVAEAIHHPKELLRQALDASTAKHKGNETIEVNESKSGLYNHLMSGVSHMLPFVIGGGILIAIAFMIDQIIGVPQDSLGSLGSYNELAKFFNTIGGASFGFMLPVLAGYIAMSIADRPGLVAGFVAGGLASSGGSGFLGALLGGFIAGYGMNAIKRIFKNLPESFAGIRTILVYPVLGVLLAGGLMQLFNIPMSQLNTMMNDFLGSLSGSNALLLGLILGAMMAIDLGGPVNKAAYVFGTGTLAASVATGGSPVMAAVMAAGMVPPLGVFLATVIFKNKFIESERQAGLTNLVLGLSFITEGAIPFASANPVPMLISFVGGSAVAGSLVLANGIKVLAPHGGIFVIMLVSNPLLYLVFIAIGSLVTALLIGLLLKKK